MIKVCGQDMQVQGRLVRIARLDGEKFTYPIDPQEMVEGLRRCGERIDLYTFLQKLPTTVPVYPYYIEYDNLAVLPITTFDNWWTRQIDGKTRNMVRRAEKKEITIREIPFSEELLRGIVEIHNETPVRQGKRFPHYGMDLDGARRYAGTFLDRSIFIGAFVDESLIGFIKLVVDESRTHACVINIIAMLQHRDKAPTNAMIAQAVRSCADRHIAYLVYEHFAYGKKKADSLSRFKEVNGFRRMDLPRYYIPVTGFGRVALRLGLHHRAADYVPEVIAAKLRDLRTSWYSARLHPFANSPYKD